MATKFNLVDYDSDDERQADVKGPTLLHLSSAAKFMVNLLDNNGVDYALMGAFALNCAGSERATRNVDIVVNTSMKALWIMLEPEARLAIPDSRLVADIMKIFVRTGKGYDDDDTTETRLVEVCSNGSPLKIASHQQILKSPTDQLWFKVLDPHYLLRSKLEAVSGRGAPKDVDDALFIVKRWPDEVRRIRGGLKL
ncbi:hypothetical protein B7494_g6 [Chlorociboria aeruginascens]|nr:hypothetical protein B7494_g6 [Chlorociboria aeruginascens]